MTELDELSSKFQRFNLKEVRETGLDKFYTRPETVSHCLKILNSKVNLEEFELLLEPSAGNGAFLLQLPSEKRLGLDICPEHEEIIQADFLHFKFPDERIAVIGNPPFGRVSSLAIKFFNHSAKGAELIAFILPRTFRRVSVQNRLDLNFHLEYDEEIPVTPSAFEPPMMAKCCFQIWIRKDRKREKIELPKEHPDWEFLPLGKKDERGQPTVPENAHFALRAYGGNCGEISTNLNSLRPKSWHWIRAKIPIESLKERFLKLDYSGSQNTARQNSIGRGELVSLYSESYD